MPRPSSKPLPPPRNWREEQRRIDAALRRLDPSSSAPPIHDTAQRVAKKKRTQRNRERVLRWQQTHPRAHAAKQRRYRRRKKRANITAQHSATKDSQPKA